MLAKLSAPVVLLLLMLAAAPVAAGELSVVPGVTFSYDDPEGLCRLEPGRGGAEKILFDTLESADEAHLATLAIFYDCAFVEALRAGHSIEPVEWVKLSATKREGEVQAFAMTRRDFIREVTPVFEKQMGGYADEAFDALVAEANKRIDEELSKQAPGARAPQLGEVQPLGLLDTDPDAIYFALLSLVTQKGADGEERQGRVLTVGAATLIRGYIVNVYVSRSFGGSGSPDPLLDRTRAFVTDLIARNDPDGRTAPPESETRPVQGSREDVYYQAAMIGLVILVVGLIAVTYMSRRRR